MNSNEEIIGVRQAWKPYNHLWQEMEIPPKTILLKEGAIARKLYYIVKGSVRMWFYHDGKEISFQFFFESEVVHAVESFRKQVPCAYSIETMEHSIVKWISKEDLDRAVEATPFLKKYSSDWAIEKQSEFIRHFFSFLKDTPLQRYKNLLNQNPEIVKRVPLKYIASYLGITDVSLSRIRNKI